MVEARAGGAIHTEGDWFAGKGSWVATHSQIDSEIAGSDDVDYYGGHLIGESISSCNIPIITAAPDMFNALLAVKQKLHFIGMPGDKVCKVTGKSDWSHEIQLLEAALKKAVTRVGVAQVAQPFDVGEGWRVIGDDEVFIAGDELNNSLHPSSLPWWLNIEVCVGQRKKDSVLSTRVCRRKIESDVIDAAFDVVSGVVSECQKPPLGLIPRSIWLENRRDDIYDAIARYRAAGKEVSREWLNELLELDDQMRPF